MCEAVAFTVGTLTRNIQLIAPLPRDAAWYKPVLDDTREIDLSGAVVGPRVMATFGGERNPAARSRGTNPRHTVTLNSADPDNRTVE